MSSAATSFDTLVALLRQRGRLVRSVTALAGPPAAGKSTLADRLAATLNDLEPGSAAVLQMDGYHFDDRVLEARGLRARKGAPETFDAAGLLHMLRRLRANAEPEVAVPVFDRSLEVARAGARIIPQAVRHLIVEGNYLLLARPPWRDLRPLFDTTVAIEVGIEELQARLAERWQGYGLNAAAIAAKLASDLANARLVIAEGAAAEIRIAADIDRPGSRR